MTFALWHLRAGLRGGVVPLQPRTHAPVHTWSVYRSNVRAAAGRRGSRRCRECAGVARQRDRLRVGVSHRSEAQAHDCFGCMRNFGYIIVLCCTSLLVGSTLAQEGGVQPVGNPALRRELIKRVKQDQAIRNELISKGVEHPDKSTLERMQTIDASNTKRMRAIIGKYGSPGPELVGRDGTEAAFLLVQHADLAFQKEVLPLVEKAYRAGKLSGQSYALLLDRVLVGEGKPRSSGPRQSVSKSGVGMSPCWSRSKMRQALINVGPKSG